MGTEESSKRYKTRGCTYRRVTVATQGGQRYWRRKEEEVSVLGLKLSSGRAHPLSPRRKSASESFTLCPFLPRFLPSDLLICGLHCLIYQLRMERSPRPLHVHPEPGVFDCRCVKSAISTGVVLQGLGRASRTTDVHCISVSVGERL